ncbi:MAG TPA: SufD family Fe-S cluster assembly protein [Thermoleophilaceae bacterium]
MQRGASVVYTHASDDRIVLSSLEQAIEEHPDLVQEHFGKRLPYDEGKFAAASAAFWTGGAFVHVPKNVQLDKPIQIVWLIDEPGTAQYAHTLAVVGEFGECKLREYCLAPDLEGQALHAGGFDLYAHPGAQVDLAHYQDWGDGEVYDISTKRVEIRRDARVKWVPVHLGGHLTKQRLDIITAEEGSDMRHTGMYFTEREEHLDLFTTDKHEAGHTTGDTVWKGALTGESRSSYEGLIEIVPRAQETHTYLQTHSMLLSPKAKSDAIPSLIVKTDNVSASHGGTVGELDEEQIFYMMTRGVSRSEAVRVLVEGYFEEVVQRLEDPGLEELVRRRIADKLRGAEEQVKEFIGERS